MWFAEWQGLFLWTNKSQEGVITEPKIAKFPFQTSNYIQQMLKGKPQTGTLVKALSELRKKSRKFFLLHAPEAAQLSELKGKLENQQL